MTFLGKLKEELSITQTQNGAKAYATTESYLLDFFAEGGAMRNKGENEIVKSFYNAFFENRLLATKCLFYMRDARGGQGERRLFRVVLKDLAYNYPEIVKLNIDNISEYGRYDDLLVLLDTPLSKFVAEYIKEQLEKDMESENPSLLVKWLPSPTTSSKDTKRLARKLCRLLDMKESRYRKLLSSLRAKVNVTEVKLSANEWETLKLNKLTANNYIKYKEAFNRHIPELYSEYIEGVKQGKYSIKSSTLYPYDIVRKVDRVSTKEDKDLLNEMWKALPDYLNGNTSSIIPIVDTSGSMYSCNEGNVAPILVSLSLGLYTAQRNEGVFNNHFITFSNRPKLQEIKGDTLYENINHMKRADWGMSTNLKATFDLILKVAKDNNISKNDMPERLLIISDMQFDSTVRNDKTIFEQAQEEFNEVGYELPIVVFWNVDAKSPAFQVKKDNSNVLLVSGCSPVIMKQVLKCSNPFDMMIDVLTSERYNKIK